MHDAPSILFPARMTRFLVVGLKTDIEKIIAKLYEMRAVHIIDFSEENENFKIGKPLKESARLSDMLIRIRAIEKICNIDEDYKPKKSLSVKELESNLPETLKSLEKKINDLNEKKNIVEEKIRKLEVQLDELRPFKDLKLNLELYRGYENLVVFIGKLSSGVSINLEKFVRDFEIITPEIKSEYIAVFVNKNDAQKVKSHLDEHGFQDVRIPAYDGNPELLFANLSNELLNLKKELTEINNELDVFRSKYGDFLVAAEEELNINVEQQEAPLRFATTKNLFIIEGWCEDKDYTRIKETLESTVGGNIEIQPLEEHSSSNTPTPQPATSQPATHELEPEQEPPIKLKTPKPFKPFEVLIEMFALPRYYEIDPTLILSLIFPLFFGFMIGDVGYGIMFIIIGLLLKFKMKGTGLDLIGWYIFIGGIFATFFGLFIFTDMFGIPFHLSEEELLHFEKEGIAAPVYSSWATLGLNIPLYAQIHKLEPSGIAQLLVISVFAAFIHLNLGFIFGFVNEWSHGKKHALSKIGWLSVLWAFSLIIFLMGSARGFGQFIWTHFFAYFVDPVIVNGVQFISLAGINIPVLTIILLVIGIILLLGSEGALAILELPGLLGNVISYTRLAAIGVAKAGMAFAFNSISLPMLFSGQIGMQLAAVLVIFITHAMLFILGGLSSGIQALRLNYVEFFLKFYKGGGISFVPFGRIRKYTIT